MNNEGNPSDSGSSSSSDNGGSSSSGRRVLFSRETGNERPRPSSAGSRALDNANYLPRQNQEVLESDSDDSDSEIAPRPLSTQMAFLRRNSTIRPRSVSATEYPLSRDLNRRAIQISRPETPPVLPAVEEFQPEDILPEVPVVPKHEESDDDAPGPSQPSKRRNTETKEGKKAKLPKILKVPKSAIVYESISSEQVLDLTQAIDNLNARIEAYNKYYSKSQNNKLAITLYQEIHFSAKNLLYRILAFPIIREQGVSLKDFERAYLARKNFIDWYNSCNIEAHLPHYNNDMPRGMGNIVETNFYHLATEENKAIDPAVWGIENGLEALYQLAIKNEASNPSEAYHLLRKLKRAVLLNLMERHPSGKGIAALRTLLNHIDFKISLLFKNSSNLEAQGIAERKHNELFFDGFNQKLRSEIKVNVTETFFARVKEALPSTSGGWRTLSELNAELRSNNPNLDNMRIEFLKTGNGILMRLTSRETKEIYLFRLTEHVANLITLDYLRHTAASDLFAQEWMSFIQSVNIGYSAQLSAIEYSAIGTITEFFSKDILRIYPTLRRYALVSLMYSFMQRLEKLMEEGACITDLKPSNLLVYGSPASRLNEFFNRIKGDIGAISLRKPEELLALLFDNLFELFLSDVKAVSGPEDHRSAKKALLSLMKKEMQITTTSIPKWLEEQEATDKNDDAALMAIMLYQLGLIFYIVATGKSEKEIADSLYHGKDFSSIFEYTSEMFQSECGQELQELCAMLLAVTPETASTTLKNSINILSMMQDKMAEMSDNKWIDEGSQRFKKEMAIQDLRTALLEFSELCSMYNFDDGFILDNINCIDEAKKDVANEASLLQMIFDGFDDFRENALEIVGVLAKKNAPPGIRNEFDDAMAEVIKTMAVVESYVNGPNNQFNNGSSEASSSSSGESSTFTVSPDKSADSSPTANGSSLRHGSVDTLIFSQSGFQYFQPANSATSSYSGLTSGSGSHSSEPASPRDSNSSSHNSPASGSPRMDGKSSSQSL